MLIFTIHSEVRNSSGKQTLSIQLDELLISLEKNEGALFLKSDTIFSRREKVHLDLALRNYDRERSGISEMSISVAPADVSAISATESEITGSQR